ncbi:MAG: hypothetical protein ACJ8ER_17220 [Allosphingosinicella sp.]
MMKRLLIAAVAAASMVGASQPAAGADLVQDGMRSPAQVSAFAGARLRVPLGGREKPQAGLALTSTMRSGPTGELRFAKGAELGFSGDDTLRLSFAGRPVSTLVRGQSGPEGRKLGVSTIGWVAIGVGVALVALYAAAQLCADGEICGEEE